MKIYFITIRIFPSRTDRRAVPSPLILSDSAVCPVPVVFAGALYVRECVNLSRLQRLARKRTNSGVTDPVDAHLLTAANERDRPLSYQGRKNHLSGVLIKFSSGGFCCFFFERNVGNCERLSSFEREAT